MTKQSPEIRKLPYKLCRISALIDPFNKNQYFIFGSANWHKCWYFDQNEQSFIEINDMPMYRTPHGCAMFETKENQNKYALIFGSDRDRDRARHRETYRATCNIYDFQTKKSNDNVIESEYGFGEGLSMITDLFAENKIHIIGGRHSERKYGYLEFNEQMANSCKLS